MRQEIEQFQALERFHEASAGLEEDPEDTFDSLDPLFSINKEIGLMAKVKATIHDL